MIKFKDSLKKVFDAWPLLIYIAKFYHFLILIISEYRQIYNSIFSLIKQLKKKIVAYNLNITFLFLNYKYFTQIGLLQNLLQNFYDISGSFVFSWSEFLVINFKFEKYSYVSSKRKSQEAKLMKKCLSLNKVIEIV